MFATWSTRRKVITITLAAVIGLFVLSVIGAALTEPAEQTSVEESAVLLGETELLPTARPTSTPAPTPTSVPLTTTPRPKPTASELTVAVGRAVKGVRDVKVKYHDADTISIMLLVDTGGQQEPARQIGDNAVRTAKTMVEGGVSSTIGSGAWEYIVGVFEPGDDDALVVGQKRREGDAIDWNVWDTTMGAPSRQAASTPTPPPPTESLVEPTPTPTAEQALKALIFCERLRLNEEIYWGISPSTLQDLDPRFSGTLDPGDYIRILTPESNNGAIRVQVYPHDLRSVSRESNDRVWIDWDILVLQTKYRVDILQLVFTCED